MAKASKILLPQNQLSDMLSVASKLATSRTTIQALSCVRITTGQSGVRVEATDMESWLTIETADFVAGDAAPFLLPCQAFLSVVQNLSNDEQLQVSLTEKQARIETENSKYNFGLLPIADWPSLEWKSKEQPFTIEAKALTEGLKFAGTCAAIKDARWYLCGVNFRADGNDLRLGGCDGHKASIKRVAVDGTPKLREEGIILPRELLAIFNEAISRFESANVVLTLNDQRARIQIENEAYRVTIIGRLIDGNFPDLDRLVPYDRDGALVTLNRNDLSNAIKRLMTLADPDDGSGIYFTFTENALSIKSKGDMGDAEERMACNTQGRKDEVKICIAAHEIVPLLGSYSGLAVDFHLPLENAHCAPVIVCESGEKVDSKMSPKLSIVMPMRG